MAIDKKNQKTFYFSDFGTKKIIEDRIEDLSKKNRQSSSSIIESILTNALLPQNEEALNIVTNFLYPKQNDNEKIKNTLIALFSSNSSGNNWSSRHNNFRPILDFCLKYRDINNSGFCNESLDYFTSQYRSIIDRIKNCIYSCIEQDEKNFYQIHLKFALILLKNLEKSRLSIIYTDFFDVIDIYWPMLYDWSITYRFLAELTSMCNFCENDPDVRIKLYEVINSVSKQWD